MLYWHYRHAVEFSKNTRTPSPNTEVPDDRGVIPSYCIVLQALRPTPCEGAPTRRSPTLPRSVGAWFVTLNPRCRARSLEPFGFPGPFRADKKKVTRPRTEGQIGPLQASEGKSLQVNTLEPDVNRRRRTNPSPAV